MEIVLDVLKIAGIVLLGSLAVLCIIAIIGLILIGITFLLNRTRHGIPKGDDLLQDMNDEELRDALGIVGSHFNMSQEELIRVLSEETWDERFPH